MSVLVDTPIWSLALRRKTGDLSSREQRIVLTLQKLAQQGEVQLLGIVRQEVLSGIRDERRFLIVRDSLRAFPDVTIEPPDFEEAAMLSNRCRRAGITSSTVDILIAAVALRNGWQILSTDADFIHYSKVIQIQLFVLPTETPHLQ